VARLDGSRLGLPLDSAASIWNAAPQTPTGACVVPIEGVVDTLVRYSVCRNGLHASEEDDMKPFTRVLALSGPMLAGALVLHSAPAQTPALRRTELQQHDLAIAGREVVQVRVDFAPGAGAPKHTHPGEEVVFTIEGSMEYRLHSARNVGSGGAAELATYIVEKGKPLVVVVK
jgi:hypothetical protein